jgi:seryl-tRNA synthetase
MLDIRLIRSEPDRVKTELAKVGVEASQVDQVLEADRVRREAIQAVEALRAERTKASNRIRDMKDPAERERAIAETRRWRPYPGGRATVAAAEDTPTAHARGAELPAS